MKLRQIVLFYMLGPLDLFWYMLGILKEIANFQVSKTSNFPYHKLVHSVIRNHSFPVSWKFTENLSTDLSARDLGPRADPLVWRSG